MQMGMEPGVTGSAQILGTTGKEQGEMPTCSEQRRLNHGVVQKPTCGTDQTKGVNNDCGYLTMWP